MSFDPQIPKFKISEKRSEFTSVTQDLFREINNSTNQKNIENRFQELLRIKEWFDDDEQFGPLEILEMKKLELEMLELKRSYRKLIEVVMAKKYATRCNLLTNSCILVTVGILYYAYSSFHEVDGSLIMLVLATSMLAAWVVLMISACEYFDYRSIPDEEEGKLGEKLKKMRRSLKSSYSLSYIQKRQKVVVNIFRNQCLPIRELYVKNREDAEDLKLKSAIPIFILLSAILLLLVSRIILEENKRLNAIALFFSFFFSLNIIPPFLFTVRID